MTGWDAIRKRLVEVDVIPTNEAIQRLSEAERIHPGEAYERERRAYHKLADVLRELAAQSALDLNELSGRLRHQRRQQPAHRDTEAIYEAIASTTWGQRFLVELDARLFERSAMVAVFGRAEARSQELGLPMSRALLRWAVRFPVRHAADKADRLETVRKTFERAILLRAKPNGVLEEVVRVRFRAVRGWRAKVRSAVSKGILGEPVAFGTLRQGHRTLYAGFAAEKGGKKVFGATGNQRALALPGILDEFSASSDPDRLWEELPWACREDAIDVAREIPRIIASPALRTNQTRDNLPNDEVDRVLAALVHGLGAPIRRSAFMHAVYRQVLPADLAFTPFTKDLLAADGPGLTLDEVQLDALESFDAHCTFSERELGSGRFDALFGD